MKKLLLLFSLIITVTFSCRSQEIELTGTWSGVSKIGPTELRIVFHIKSDGAAYSGAMDSPDQGAKGIPVSSIELEGSEVSIEIKAIGFKYTGTIEGDAITGSFTQGGATFPLDLTRGDVATRSRPQEPRPPFPYRSEEVAFDNKEAGITLAGTLTLPPVPGKYPAVITISGSGPQDRNEEIFDHKPFLVIADHLTRRGIAVLRYDDRGTAMSAGTFKGSTSQDFMHDAMAAVEYLRARDDIDPAKIGVIGHSEGGTIAVMMAAHDQQIGFIIPMAGSMLRGDSTLVMQNRDILLSQGSDEAFANLYCNAVAAMYRMKYRGIPVPSDQLAGNIAGFVDLPESVQESLVEIYESNDPWMDYFLTYDPTDDIRKITCPVFAINGNKDLQVNAQANLSHLEAILQDEGHFNYTTRAYPGLNHLFQQSETGNVTEYGRIEQTIYPQVLEDISDWILEITK